MSLRVEVSRTSGERIFPEGVEVVRFTFDAVSGDRVAQRYICYCHPIIIWSEGGEGRKEARSILENCKCL